MIYSWAAAEIFANYPFLPLDLGTTSIKTLERWLDELVISSENPTLSSLQWKQVAAT